MRGVEPERQPHWDWRAAANFIGGGSGAGLFLFAAVAAGEHASWLARVGPLAPLLVLAGLAGVGSELGRPLRALNVFRRPRTSWMSREAIVVAAFLPVSVAAIVLRAPAVAGLGALLGLALLYCQARMLRAAKGVPAWRDPAIVPLVLATGLVEGGAIFVILAAALAEVPGWSLLALFALIAARLFAWATYQTRVCAPRAAPRGTLDALERIRLPFEIAGHLVPLGLVVIALAASSSLAAGAAATLALCCGWALKLTLVTRAAYNQGFAIARAPARSPGFSHPGVKPGWA
jgi:phenylacetyl-CoA:acceptor oxidoreductase subunit 2